MRVLLAGGGTAGHTSPLLATADALRRLAPDVEITCLGTARGLETRVVPEAGYPLELIAPVPLPRRPGVDLLKVPVRLTRAVREAGAVLDRTGTDVLVGFGGDGSVAAHPPPPRPRPPHRPPAEKPRPRPGHQARARDAPPGAGGLPRPP